MNRYYLSAAVAFTFVMLTAFLLLAVNVEVRARNVSALSRAEARKADVALFLRLMSDAETAQRGLLLTQDPKYLQPLVVARQQGEPVLDRLVNSYYRDSNSGAETTIRPRLLELRQLRDLQAAKINEIQATLALNAREGPAAAIALLRTNLGKQTTDQLRETIASLGKAEDQQIAMSLRQWSQGISVTRLLLLSASLLIVSLILISSYLLNRDLRRRDELSRQLANHAHELERTVDGRTAELSALSTHLQYVAEREKAAIARELHDELGGLMIAAKMDVSWLEKRLASQDQDIKLRWERLRKLLEDGLNMKRRVVETLRPTLLDNMGLVPAVKWIYDETCKRGGLKGSARFPEGDVVLSDEASIAVFRVVQEALTNVLKHAKAKEVHLEMTLGDDQLKLEIRDNGIGMSGATPAGGHGMLSMRHRMTSLGGTTQIAAAPGGGTAIHIALPLDRIRARQAV
ncbi:MAG: CHASE3 domain-containing protein [Bryobacteraceae bacterium]